MHESSGLIFQGYVFSLFHLFTKHFLFLYCHFQNHWKKQGKPFIVETLVFLLKKFTLYLQKQQDIIKYESL